MNGTLSSNHIFLSFNLKNYFFLESGIKRATAGFADACMLVITKELPSFHQRGFNQANNEALHPHPLTSTALRLACCVWRNWITKVSLTTEHTKLHVGQLFIWKTLLELQTGRGGFSQKWRTLRWNTKVSLNRYLDMQCCHHTPWMRNLSPRRDI